MCNNIGSSDFSISIMITTVSAAGLDTDWLAVMDGHSQNDGRDELTALESQTEEFMVRF